LELGFIGSKSDSSLFIFESATVTILALVYVDDIIFTGSSSTAISYLIQALATELPVKDLGDLNFFLGIAVSRVSSGLFLSQHRYITDLLTKTNMLNAKPITSPMSVTTSLSKFSGLKFSDPTLYRSTVGGLQYLSLTRPDIAFAVSKVSQFMHEPRDVHWSAVKRILRYLKSTVNPRLVCGMSIPLGK
jgi:hypothetical protein